MYPTSSKLIFRFFKKYQCLLNKKDWFLKVFQGHFLRPQLVMNLVDLQIKKPLLVQLTAQHIQVFHWQDTFYQQLKHGSFLSLKKIYQCWSFLLFIFIFFRMFVDFIICLSYTALAPSYPHVVYSAFGIICRDLSNSRPLSAVLICMNYVSVISVCCGRAA